VQSKALIADGGFAAQSLKSCNTDLRYLNQVIGWQVKWPRQWKSIVSSGLKPSDDTMTKWSQVPSALSSATDKLRLGITSKETAPRAVVIRIQQQIDDLSLALTQENSKYSFSNIEDQSSAKWNGLIKESIAPAVDKFSQFITAEYLPAARKQPGLASVDGGEKCFINAVTWWTTLDMSHEKIETIGRKYLNDSANQLLATGVKGDTVKSMLASLRAHSKEEHTTTSMLIDISEKALARAHNKTLLSFSMQTEKEIKVSKMPQYMQDSAPAGYYGKAQSKIPARYIINPSRPNERRLMAEVIAFHEGVPGHHLWVTYPREVASKGYNSGILEGWALYSEYLADEMDLYSSTFDRQGMITKHLWTASRLIVEPGIHLRGWSREDAINFMLNNTVMSRTEIEIEVDRYIAMPGQSLSYILGADLILSERERAQNILGKTFDLAKFHDVILLAGVRSLSQVQSDIRSWVNEMNI